MPNKLITSPAEIREVDKIEGSHPSLATLKQMEFNLREIGERSTSNTPIKANCNTRYHARRSSGRRPLSVVDLIVMHCTQGSTAQAAASWFANPDSAGSAHLCVDDNFCFRTMEDNEIPWGAPGANYHGIHIEQAGFVTYSKAIWSNTHRRTIMRAAYKAAHRCKKYGISTRFLTSNQLRQGIRDGITTHYECTKAFGGNHTDPGPNWPRFLFMALVRMYHTAMKVKLV